MKPLRSYISLGGIVFLLLMAACANRVMPTGGPVDKREPVLTETTPAEGATGFKGDKIIITFDEYVQLKNAGDAIAISPPIEPAPRAQVQKKSVVLELPDSLQENTTYTIDFGDAISDLNEGNAVRGYRFVFSTGTVIDTLSLSGRIIDALTLKPVAGALAVVFPAGIPDSMLAITRPSYFGRAGDDGSFNISNMRDGSYRVFGLDDKNGNLRANLPDEKLGFLDEAVVPQGQSVELKLSAHIPLKQNVLGTALDEPGRLTVNFARPLGDYKLRFIGQTPDSVFTSAGVRGDTLTIVFVPRADSAEVEITENGIVLDTVRARLSRGSNAAIATQKYMLWTGVPSAGSPLIPGVMPAIRWMVPLTSSDTSRMRVYRDTMQVTYRIRTDAAGLLTSFESDYTEGSYSILLLPGAVSDVFGRSNDTIRYVFNVPAERSRGSLTVIVKSSSQARILQLISEKDEVRRQVMMPAAGTVEIAGIDPGVYRIRMITDSNGNGYWDPGNFRTGIQPEPVSIYPDQVTVRANWEMEVVWE